jgi:hypothetical protein
MDRRAILAALQKATIDTTVGEDGLLNPEQSKSFIQTIKDKSDFGKAIRFERRRAESGEINKLTSSSRLLRGKAENADDGYRAEVGFPTTDYQTGKVWLPWEVTEDFYNQNIEGQAAEAKILDEMTQQFALDLDDLRVNGDEESGDPFLKIDDGLLEKCEDSAVVHRVDGEKLKNAKGEETKGVLDKAHFFAAKYAMPNQYINTGKLVWLASPNRITSWTEYLTDRATSAGDAALFLEGKGPLGIPYLPVPAFPDSRIVLTDPQNLVEVVTWDVRRKKVTGDTDWELATRDKRGYLFFLSRDFIILEEDAVVDVHKLAAIE